MNQDVFNACRAVYKKFREGMVCFIENATGEVTFGGEVNEEGWLAFCRGVEGNPMYKKLHLCNVTPGRFEWLESYDTQRKMCDIPIDISDEIFLKLAQEAHEQDITINQLVAKKLQAYIDHKKEIV